VAAVIVTAVMRTRHGGDARLGVAGNRHGTAPRDAIGWLVIVAVMGVGHGQGGRCQLAAAVGDGRCGPAAAGGVG
jgi:hypothetical protein